MAQPESATICLHFDPREPLPDVGDTARYYSTLTDTWYQITLHTILAQTTLPDGRIRIEAHVTRIAEEP
jgi:hypothetical protein